MTPSSVENVLALQRPDDPQVTPSRLGLSWLDRLSLERMVKGDATNVVEHVRSLAEALAGPEGNQVRLRTLARTIAVTRAEQGLLEAMIMERLAERDIQGVELVDKVLKGVAGRLVKLLEAHRLESSQQRRVSVVVTHADQVNVEGVE